MIILHHMSSTQGIKVTISIRWDKPPIRPAKTFAWKFLTVTEKSSNLKICYLWRQWPCLLQIKIRL